MPGSTIRLAIHFQRTSVAWLGLESRYYFIYCFKLNKFLVEFLLPGMPELPEVETIKSQLNRLTAGKKIASVNVLLPKIVKLPVNKFKKAIIGAKIKKIARRAKILIVEMDNGWTMLIHLKMTGQLIYQSTDDNQQITTRNKYTHVIFYFTDKSRLLFNDLRQFGYIKLIKTAELSNFFLEEGTGPEPLEKDFTLTDFRALLAKRPGAKIKQFLMDPKNIAGIGNIYADEILFFAGIHPLRQVKSLEETEIKKIFKGIKDILKLAIKLRGTSSNDYLDAFGQPGKFAAKLKVYGKKGEKCVRCKGTIEKIKVGGRSASFCPSCQK